MRRLFSKTAVRFFMIFLFMGFFSPSLTVEKYTAEGMCHISYTILSSAEARRGGGMRGGGGMRRSGGFSRGGMSRGSFNRSSMNRSRMRAPSRSRYQGGNFYKAKRPSSGRPVKRPSAKPSTRPAQRPSAGRPGVGKPGNGQRPNRPGNGNRPNKPGKPGVRPPGNRPGNPGARPPGPRPGPGHRPPMHRPGHGHYHHYPHHGWGGYWPWFWGSAIVVGAIVSTIPDNDCDDIHVDGKWYKECNGVLFEPVYQGDDVEYKVVKIKK